MTLHTVIFDIDGLLINSEPLWNEAAAIIFKQQGIVLTPQQYQSTTGLRTKEFIEHWFRHFQLPPAAQPQAEKEIVDIVLDLITQKADIMPGVGHIFEFFARKDFKMGLATSSPQALIDMVIKMIGLKDYLSATASAEDLAFGKPHPQVYLDCAQKLNSSPLSCICFEDSFNGMIAAKAARMKCVVIPHPSEARSEKWGAADLRLSSLQNFGQLHFDGLMTQ
ncbi:MAG: hexitol phosphatase HxpB [Sphingobacteriia bacterium]|nr:MAG: hexitol phosphatase HxpB [Sphingobacteriia bacterium]